MKRLYSNYAESMSHGLDIHNLFQDNQLKGLFTWKEGALANRAYPPRRVET